MTDDKVGIAIAIINDTSFVPHSSGKLLALARIDLEYE
ncbi:hypothetical protein VAA_04237 [Vibrio anguillarum 775]|nr:hypothetical protein VAA_04237 [Vibrio anguillarum 775]AGU58916.1 hypothetical protein N175_09780 [Vibrio anguillarum M3]ARV26574.1 hypothetical protein A6A12_0883 [Vibrio anguillarum]